MSNEDEEDPRFNYIKFNTLELLAIESSLWDDFIWKEENKIILKDFMNTPTSTLLVIYFSDNKKLLVVLDISDLRVIPQVLVYFTKTNISVPTENYKKYIMCGCISNPPLIQYQKLFNKVLYPIFTNPSNNNRWPKEIAEDVIVHFQDFKKNLAYHIGVAQIKTVLVVPEIVKDIENFNIDEISADNTNWYLCNILNSISDMICDWISIVKEVLEVTSEDILLKVQQGPVTEIEFWNDRKMNLQFIQEQLNDLSLEKILLALKKSNNCHFELFKTLLQDVVEALDEASEISESLSMMSDKLQVLETCEFSALIKELPDAVKTITASWINSKYFKRVPSRICIIIKKLCYFLIEKIQQFLNPSEVFKLNQTEMKEKVEVSIEVSNVFLKSYSEFQAIQEDKTYPWEFPDKRVFNYFENFLRRLNNIYEIFESCELYYSVLNYNILGIHLSQFKIRLNKLVSTFKEYYNIFIESTYNPLDLTFDEFIEDYNTFFFKVKELDRKLGTTLAQACIACSTSEDTFKLMNLVHDLLKRSLVNEEFKKLITYLLNNIFMELHAAKENYKNLSLLSKEIEQIAFKNIPAYSSILQWSMDMKNKLSFPVKSLQEVEHLFINADDGDLIFRTYEDINELLLSLEAEIVNKWKAALNSVKELLTKPLFISDDKNYFQLNFAPQILDITQEIHYVKMIKKENLFSSEALDMDEKLNTILYTYSLLACTTRWFNDLNENLMEFEKALVRNEWENASKALLQGLNDNWNKSELQEYAESIYTITKSLFERINQAKENVHEVEMHIDTWSKMPVFVRDSPDSLVNFDVLNTSQMQQQICQVIETSMNMNRAMEENMVLFECDSNSEEWKKYVTYLESIIENGLNDSIKSSLKYLVENTDRENKKLAPFFRINMILEEDIKFVPPIDKHQTGSLYKLLEAVITNIYNPCTKIQRMTDINEDYLKSINESSNLNDLKEKVFSNLECGTNLILAQLVDYQNYADLWLQEIDTVLEDFVLYGFPPEVKTDEEGAIIQLDEALDIKIPTESEFRTQIAQFEMLQKNVEDIPLEIQVESWLLLNVSSFKESLLQIIRDWSTAYKKKLIELKTQGKLRKPEDDSDM